MSYQRAIYKIYDRRDCESPSGYVAFKSVPQGYYNEKISKYFISTLRIDYCGFGPFGSTLTNLMMFISLLKVLIYIMH